MRYEPISAAEHMAELVAAEESWWLYAYSSMFASIREHRWARVTDEVQQLTGRLSRSFSPVLGEPALSG